MIGFLIGAALGTGRLFTVAVVQPGNPLIGKAANSDYLDTGVTHGGSCGNFHSDQYFPASLRRLK